MNTTNDSFIPLSALERQKLLPVCAELGLNPASYESDESLCDAITEAVLAEIMAEGNERTNELL